MQEIKKVQHIYDFLNEAIVDKEIGPEHYDTESDEYKQLSGKREKLNEIQDRIVKSILKYGGQMINLKSRDVKYKDTNKPVKSSNVDIVDKSESVRIGVSIHGEKQKQFVERLKEIKNELPEYIEMSYVPKAKLINADGPVVILKMDI